MHPRLLVALALLAACTSEQDVVRRTQEDVFFQSATDMADILWVIDNSGSMRDEQAEVAARFDGFLASLAGSDLQFRLGVVTTDIADPDQRGKLQGDPAFLTADDPGYAAEFARRVQVGTDGSDREAGIDAAYKALSEPLVSNVNDGFVREGATLAVIYVSDENDCSDRGALAGYDSADACYSHGEELVPVRDLVDDYRSLKTGGERILVSAVVGPEGVENCNGAVPGYRYLEMAQAFGGLQASICEADFSDIMAELGLQVSGTIDSFRLTYAAVPDTIEVWVDEVPVAEDEDDGWTYDETYWVLYFHGAGVPPRGSQIRVKYEVASGAARPDTGE